MSKITREDALEYHHLNGRPGKISVVPTKPMATQRDLGLAYTPGVAVPVLEIEKDPELAYEYTSKGNLVAVISNGTAILGLEIAEPWLENQSWKAKGYSLKNSPTSMYLISRSTHMIPRRSSGSWQPFRLPLAAFDLEDIKAPECFHIEETLKGMLDIPVFHDDQHGTAIISGAALVNGLEIIGKDIAKVRIVISGAGAAAISCAELMVRLGVTRSNIMLVDFKRCSLQRPYRWHE